MKSNQIVRSIRPHHLMRIINLQTLAGKENTHTTELVIVFFLTAAAAAAEEDNCTTVEQSKSRTGS